MNKVIILIVGLFFTHGVYASQYDPGASDKEIKIGNTAPYSGPIAFAAKTAEVQAAYFNKINAEGGIHGRKIVFLSQNDEYSPAKTVALTRQLIEQKKVLFIFNPIGTSTSSAVQAYLNEKKIPQLFVYSGADRFMQPQKYPWSMGVLINYENEAKIYADYLLKNVPNAKIGILYQNDDYGKDFVKGFKKALGVKADSMIVKIQSYNATEQTVDPQIIQLKSSGANVFLDISIAKITAQAIRKMHTIGWAPLHIINYVSASKEAVFLPMGYDKVQGVMSIQLFKEPNDPRWKDDKGIKDYLDFMRQYYPKGDVNSRYILAGYTYAQMLIQVLKQCGNDLTRENVMNQATQLKLTLPLLLPGIEIETSPTDYSPLKKVQLAKLVGENWENIGPVVDVPDIK